MRHNCFQQLVVDVSVVGMWYNVCDMMWYKAVMLEIFQGIIGA